jgi:hypothetical protein
MSCFLYSWWKHTVCIAWAFVPVDAWLVWIYCCCCSKRALIITIIEELDEGPLPSAWCVRRIHHVLHQRQLLVFTQCLNRRSTGKMQVPPRFCHAEMHTNMFACNLLIRMAMLRGWASAFSSLQLPRPASCCAVIMCMRGFRGNMILRAQSIKK